MSRNYRIETLDWWFIFGIEYSFKVVKYMPERIKGDIKARRVRTED